MAVSELLGEKIGVRCNGVGADRIGWHPPRSDINIPKWMNGLIYVTYEVLKVTIPRCRSGCLIDWLIAWFIDLFTYSVTQSISQWSNGCTSPLRSSLNTALVMDHWARHSKFLASRIEVSYAALAIFQLVVCSVHAPWPCGVILVKEQVRRGLLFTNEVLRSSVFPVWFIQWSTPLSAVTGSDKVSKAFHGQPR